MKKAAKVLLALAAFILVAGCAQTSPVPSEAARALGINARNYPRIDGSTSTLPLVQGIYRSMFLPDIENPYAIWSGMPESASKTMASYELLLGGEVDLIIVPDPSEEVRRKAEDIDVSLEFVPIGAEALVFITPTDNPAENITARQIKEIYCDMTMTDWSDLRGNPGKIVPICRNADSGSQAQMERLLEGRAIHPAIEENYIAIDMNSIIRMTEAHREFAGEGEEDTFTLGYTLFYYLHNFQYESGDKAQVKMLNFEAVAPTPQTLLSGEYSLTTAYYAVFRKDLPQNHAARKIAQWLTTREGQWTVVYSGLGALAPLHEPVENHFE